MRFFARLMLSAFALGATSVQAAEPTFDLICRGLSGQKLHYRFDLAQKKWCIDQCQSVWGIDRLSDSMIELVTFSSDGQNDWTIKIDRYTGAFAAIRRGFGSEPKDTGACEAKTFSGFPGKKF
ncbi:hypothetical protein EEB18_018565 [Sphingopyxis sp. OPL5]|uniref:hypothetical protein n=1 Tax=Sphingopyxis sp. OPL5 TaxID=2486273 RepID=UPI00164D0772|nr:hypothetical protein [Sphingopyxis sp. OPL5]QNO26710.1 hypothetical protein EEB18_018565 [Sphingopyxis sp. OPL5]